MSPVTRVVFQPVVVALFLLLITGIYICVVVSALERLALWWVSLAQPIDGWIIDKLTPPIFGTAQYGTVLKVSSDNGSLFRFGGSDEMT